MPNETSFRFRDRSAAIFAALGVASAMTFGGVMVAPTVATAAAAPHAHSAAAQAPSLAGSAVRTWSKVVGPISPRKASSAARVSGLPRSSTSPASAASVTSPASAGSSGSGSSGTGSASSGYTGYTGACTQTISPGTDPAAAESSMSAGQVLCLNSGTYQSITQSSANTFTGSGTSGSPVVVTSGPGQTATIQGADYVNGNYVTFEYLNLDQADVLYSSNGGSNPAPCAYPLSEGMQINGNNVTIQDDNVYESSHRGVLIGIGYGGSPSNQSSGDIIRNDNLGPAGGCSDSQHLIYADYTSGLQVYGNWFFDDPYGFGVQLYQSDSNADIHSNVFDNVLDATIEASNQGGNVTEHNVAINSAQVTGWGGFTGQFVDCYAGSDETIASNAIFNVPNGFGSCPSGVSVTGSTTLAANPFVGGQNSDNYTLASNAAASQVAGYGLWNGQGTPSPNPALSFPADPANTATVNGQAVPTA